MKLIALTGTITPFGLENLKILSAFLRTLAAPIGEDNGSDEAMAFDLSHWACGTAMCAVGWGCTIPELKQRGLLGEGGAPVCYTDRDNNVAPADADLSHTFVFRAAGWVAVRYFFGMGGDPQATVNREGYGTQPLPLERYLFDGEHYPENATPAMVSDRIDALLLLMGQ